MKNALLCILALFLSVMFTGLVLGGLMLLARPVKAEMNLSLPAESSMYSPGIDVSFVGECPDGRVLSLATTAVKQEVFVTFGEKRYIFSLYASSRLVFEELEDGDGPYVVKMWPQTLASPMNAQRRDTTHFFGRMLAIPVKTVTVVCAGDDATLTVVYETGASRGIVVTHTMPIN